MSYSTTPDDTPDPMAWEEYMRIGNGVVAYSENNSTRYSMATRYTLGIGSTAGGLLEDTSRNMNIDKETGGNVPTYDEIWKDAPTLDNNQVLAEVRNLANLITDQPQPPPPPIDESTIENIETLYQIKVGAVVGGFEVTRATAHLLACIRKNIAASFECASPFHLILDSCREYITAVRTEGCTPLIDELKEKETYRNMSRGEQYKARSDTVLRYTNQYKPPMYEKILELAIQWFSLEAGTRTDTSKWNNIFSDYMIAQTTTFKPRLNAGEKVRDVEVTEQNTPLLKHIYERVLGVFAQKHNSDGVLYACTRFSKNTAAYPSGRKIRNIKTEHRMRGEVMEVAIMWFSNMANSITGILHIPVLPCIEVGAVIGSNTLTKATAACANHVYTIILSHFTNTIHGEPILIACDKYASEVHAEVYRAKRENLMCKPSIQELDWKSQTRMFYRLYRWTGVTRPPARENIIEYAVQWLSHCAVTTDIASVRNGKIYVGGRMIPELPIFPELHIGARVGKSVVTASNMPSLVHAYSMVLGTFARTNNGYDVLDACVQFAQQMRERKQEEQNLFKKTSKYTSMDETARSKWRRNSVSASLLWGKNHKRNIMEAVVMWFTHILTGVTNISTHLLSRPQYKMSPNNEGATTPTVSIHNGNNNSYSTINTGPPLATTPSMMTETPDAANTTEMPDILHSQPQGFINTESSLPLPADIEIDDVATAPSPIEIEMIPISIIPTTDDIPEITAVLRSQEARSAMEKITRAPGARIRPRPADRALVPNPTPPGSSVLTPSEGAPVTASIPPLPPNPNDVIIGKSVGPISFTRKTKPVLCDVYTAIVRVFEQGAPVKHVFDQCKGFLVASKLDIRSIEEENMREQPGFENITGIELQKELKKLADLIRRRTKMDHNNIFELVIGWFTVVARGKDIVRVDEGACIGTYSIPALPSTPALRVGQYASSIKVSDENLSHLQGIYTRVVSVFGCPDTSPEVLDACKLYSNAILDVALEAASTAHGEDMDPHNPEDEYKVLRYRKTVRERARKAATVDYTRAMDLAIIWFASLASKFADQ